MCGAIIPGGGAIMGSIPWGGNPGMELCTSITILPSPVRQPPPLGGGTGATVGAAWVVSSPMIGVLTIIWLGIIGAWWLTGYIPGWKGKAVIGDTGGLWPRAVCDMPFGSGQGTLVKSFSLSLLPVKSSRGITLGSVVMWRSSSGSAAESGILKKNCELEFNYMSFFYFCLFKFVVF